MTTLFPAEWAVQDAVMLTWPHRDTDWHHNLKRVEQTYLTIAKAILTEQALLIVAQSQALQEHIETLFNNNELPIKNVFFVIANSNDSWARDHGPICVYQKNKLIALNFIFNGWGNKYACELDNKINEQIAKSVLSSQADYQAIDLILEGGGIETDGQGTLLATKQCLLNPNRNQGLEQHHIEQRLKTCLGISHFLWLENGYLAGDDTDSHIDTLARFAPNNAIVYVHCNDEHDEHFYALQKMESEIQQFKTPDHQPYTLYPLPWPSAKYNDNNQRLPATYANYLIINNKILVPTYRDPNDHKALNVIASAYPEHQVLGIDCVDLIEQFGSLHCITMQLPKGFLRSL